MYFYEIIRATGQGSPMNCFCIVFAFFLRPGFVSRILGQPRVADCLCFFLRLGGCLPRRLSLRRKQNAKQTQSKRKTNANKTQQKTQNTLCFACFSISAYPPPPKTHKKRKTNAKQTQSKRKTNAKTNATKTQNKRNPKYETQKRRKTEMQKKRKQNTKINNLRFPVCSFLMIS